MILRIRKNFIIIFILAACFALSAAFPMLSTVSLSHTVYAAEEHIWTRDEVDSLETLTSVPVGQIANWPQYNSRDYGIVTSVKNQGSTNLCWVYGSLAAMETNILRQGFSGKTKDNLDLDEEEFAKAASGKWDDPLNIADGDTNQKSESSIIWNKEGAISWVTQFAARGQGVYQTGEISGEQPTERYSSYFLRNAITCDNEVSQIKNLIAQYGGVAFAYHSGIMNKTYLYATGANDHASFIVGWDDTIPKGSFFHPSGTVPQQDGGWIVKNSYGTDEFENGYCYLSYDSALFEVTAFDMMSRDEYDWCYNYSNLVYSAKGYSSCTPNDAMSTEYAAIYKAQKGEGAKEYLKGVCVGVGGKDMQISVAIYVNVDESATRYSKNSSTFNPKQGELVTTAIYSAPSTGIYTVPIQGMPTLDKDAYFTVLIKVSGGSVVYDFFAYRGDTMTYVLNKGQWDDLSSPMSELAIRGLLSIKALTVTRTEGEVLDLSGANLSLPKASYVYTGAEIEPEVTVTLGDDTLTPGKDYELSYANNVSAGQATVTVAGIGRYTGKASVSFTINKAESPVLPDEYRKIYVEKAKTLKDIELPDRWKWVDEETELIVGEQSVYAEYIGDDRENYLSTQVEIKLTVGAILGGTENPDPENPGSGGGETKPDPTPEHKHTPIFVPRLEPNCTTDGHTAYYVCDGCGEWFEDEKGETEIADRDSVVIPAAHDYSDVEWNKDADRHWKECKVCGEHAHNNAHDSDGEDGACSVCGYEAPKSDPRPTPDDDGDEKSKPTDEDDNTVAVAVGVSVGVAGAGSIIGVVVYLFVRRRRRL